MSFTTCMLENRLTGRDVNPLFWRVLREKQSARNRVSGTPEPDKQVAHVAGHYTYMAPDTVTPEKRLLGSVVNRGLSEMVL